MNLIKETAVFKIILVMEYVMIRTILPCVVTLMGAIAVQTRILWVMEFVTLTTLMLDVSMIKEIVVMKAWLETMNVILATKSLNVPLMEVTVVISP